MIMQVPFDVLMDLLFLTSILQIKAEYILISAKMEPGLRSRYSDSLGAGRSGDRIPVEAKFFESFQTGPGAYQAYYAMGTGSFPGVKWLGRGIDHPPQLAPRLKKE